MNNRPLGVATHAACSLILLWVKIPNPGSHSLNILRRHPPEHGTQRDHIAPELIKVVAEAMKSLAPLGLLTGRRLDWVWNHSGQGHHDRT